MTRFQNTTPSQEGFAPGTRFFTVATAGHVDHGKTSLIRALTGIDPDRLKEEKERQMTTDLGFAHLMLGELMVGFVDVPGHGKFLKNMLAGVGGIDVALLVVAADEGPMPQTVQHVRILSLLGVNKAIVAMTKVDAVSDPEHIELVKQSIAELLDQHGVELLELIPVSSTKNIGLDQLKQSIQRNLSSTPPREQEGTAFLPVDRVFSKSGFGTVITGTLVRGKLSVGDQVTIGPDVATGRVRRLETHGHLVDVARQGQRVACNLVLKEEKEIHRGHVVLGATVPSSKMFVVSLMDRPRITSGKFAGRVAEQPVRLYHGTAEHHGYIRWAEDLPVHLEDKEAQAVAFIVLNEPAVAQPGDRFVVRLSDESIYGGRVILRDKLRWMNRALSIQLAQMMLRGDAVNAAMTFIQNAPQQMMKLQMLELLLSHDQIGSIVQELASERKIAQLADTLMPLSVREELSRRLHDAVSRVFKQHEEAKERVDAVSLEMVRSQLNPKLDRPTFQALVDDEVAGGKLLRKGDKLSLPGVKMEPANDGKTSALEQKITQALEENFCLDLDELAKACQLDVQSAKQAAQTMQKNGRLHLINYEFVINDQNLKRAHQVLADVWQAKRNIAPTDFREALQTTRKYAMALLQHFDDNKITRRLPSGRVLLKAPSS